MKKGLEKIVNGTVNVATNALLCAGALEYVQGLSESGESGYTTGLAGAAAIAGIYGLNKAGIISGARSMVSKLSKKFSEEYSPVIKTMG